MSWWPSYPAAGKVAAANGLIYLASTLNGNVGGHGLQVLRLASAAPCPPTPAAGGVPGASPAGRRTYLPLAARERARG